jgi:hypothetical protein
VLPFDAVGKWMQSKTHHPLNEDSDWVHDPARGAAVWRPWAGVPRDLTQENCEKEKMCGRLHPADSQFGHGIPIDD